MKRVYVAVLAAMALISCKKSGSDNGGTVVTSISVSEINSQSGDEAVSVDTIKLVVENVGFIAATAAITSTGGFTMASLAAPNDDGAVISSFFNEDAFDITLNPAEAKGLEAKLKYDTDGNEVCEVVAYSDEVAGGGKVQLDLILYAAQDVTITLAPKNTSQAAYNLALKRGWNMVYQDKRTSDNRQFISALPDGITLKWYYRLP